MSWSRRIISLALLGHLAAVLLNNFAWSPFIAAVFPYYGWYIDVSGQAQNWGMYQNPNRFDARYELTSMHRDGRESVRWLDQDGERLGARALYFLESLFYGDEHLATARAEALLKRAMHKAADDTLTGMRLTRWIRPTPEPEDGLPGEAYQKDASFVWNGAPR
jgi:hypothetical protein